MSYDARLLSATNHPMHDLWQGLRPLRLSWTALGGCDEALLKVEGSRIDITWWQGYLGHPVEVYDDSGTVCWWGWLEAVHETGAGMKLGFDLAKMANRLAVVYRSQEPGDGFGAPLQTAWADDVESQALYGVKERLVQAGSLSDEQAEHWRDHLLKDMRLPTLQGAAAANEGNKGVHLVCKGWIHRLNWRSWQRESDVIGNTVSQSGVQAIGNSTEQAKMAQSFTVSRGVLLSALALRLRKQGAPSDKLRVEIRVDQGGSPSASALAAYDIDPGDLADHSYTWVTAKFASQMTLAAGTTYWFVLSRTGPISSTAYYWMGLDENLSFAEGHLKRFIPADQSWAPRIPLADALFKLTCLSRVDDDIVAMLALGGDFLSGFDLQNPSGLRLPGKANAGEPLLNALSRLLALGTVDHKRYLMDLNQNRFLNIFLEPEKSDIPFTLVDSGQICDSMGRVIQDKSQLVGKRVAMSHEGSFLVNKVDLDAVSGRFSLKTI